MKFSENLNTELKEIRKMNSTVDIEVDGGINDKTITKCIEAGANVFVAGSYVFGGDYQERISSLKKEN